jgi:cobalt-zinc-cadmium efflux system protein
MRFDCSATEGSDSWPGSIVVNGGRRGHEHGGVEGASDRRVVATVALNLLLTLGEIVGGILAGSVALVADAMHNLNDALALVNVLIARRISRRSADERRTFGYRRAKVVGGLINLVALVVVGLFLAYESIVRLFEPSDVGAWTMVALAGLALAVDVLTVVLLFVMRKGSINVRAAFVHNMPDALASLVVMLGGFAILLFDATWVDPLLSLLIVGYIFWQAWRMIPEAVNVLMEGSPDAVSLSDVAQRLRRVDGVVDVHHLHVWMLDEQHKAFEGHLVLDDRDLSRMDIVKEEARTVLDEEFGIVHATLEVESQATVAAESHDTRVIHRES